MREAGILNVISLMLSDLTDKLNKDHSPFVENVTREFDSVADCLAQIIVDPSNAAVFKRT